jgi:hypothetical protein
MDYNTNNQTSSNRARLIWIAVLAIGIIGLIAYFTTDRSDRIDDGVNQTGTSTATTTTGTGAGAGVGAGTGTGQNGADDDDDAPALRITSIAPEPAAPGNKLTIRGDGFATMPPEDQRNSNGWLAKKHLMITIENESGTKALLWEGNPDESMDNVITVDLSSKICTDSIDGDVISPTTCTSYLDITSGDYKVVARIDFLELTSNTYTLTVR